MGSPLQARVEKTVHEVETHRLNGKENAAHTAISKESHVTTVVRYAKEPSLQYTVLPIAFSWRKIHQVFWITIVLRFLCTINFVWLLGWYVFLHDILKVSGFWISTNKENKEVV